MKEITIYTDGACIGNGKATNIGGYSFVVVKNEESIFEKAQVNYNTTNNRQEILGVLEALRYCVEHDIKSFSIYSDSQYVVNGFNSWMIGWSKKGFMRGYPTAPIPNADLWKQMYSVKQSFQGVDLKWVRGHNGNKWNERADELINIAMSQSEVVK